MVIVIIVIGGVSRGEWPTYYDMKLYCITFLLFIHLCFILNAEKTEMVNILMPYCCSLYGMTNRILFSCTNLYKFVQIPINTLCIILMNTLCGSLELLYNTVCQRKGLSITTWQCNVEPVFQCVIIIFPVL